ncbi:MAG: pyridoxal-phosphate dependent enzyme, partial [Selenomonadaceae bacterium]|nr:pyridoxal-phosphate dependent enzyme [Selenomonadaceae bacterium]
MEFYCSKCGKRESVSTRKAHCDCGGLWKLDFQPPKFDLSELDHDEWSMFRYRKFMALEDETWRGITLGEGMTPIVQLDENVLLKMDYFMPTLSFKDRGAAVLIAHCKAIGVESVVQDSSGNAGNSIAAYCARAGIKCEIFVKDGTSPKKIDMIRAHGATC